MTELKRLSKSTRAGNPHPAACIVSTLHGETDDCKQAAANGIRSFMKYIGFELIWYDAWIGFFYDQKKGILYFCPLPCCVFKWRNTTTRAVDECLCLREKRPHGKVAMYVNPYCPKHGIHH